jgi:hypothetical protein
MMMLMLWSTPSKQPRTWLKRIFMIWLYSNDIQQDTALHGQGGTQGCASGPATHFVLNKSDLFKGFGQSSTLCFVLDLFRHVGTTLTWRKRLRRGLQHADKSYEAKVWRLEQKRH